MAEQAGFEPAITAIAVAFSPTLLFRMQPLCTVSCRGLISHFKLKLIIDPYAPHTAQVSLQRFGLSDSIKGASLDVPDQI